MGKTILFFCATGAVAALALVQPPFVDATLAATAALQAQPAPLR